MSEIAISNLAISLVGGNSIISLSDPTLEAEECNRYYDLARKFCLEQRDWSFATSTRKLAPEVVALSTEFEYSFALPADCLVVRRCSADAGGHDRVVYQKESRSIVTDSAEIFIRYTKDETDTSRFSPSFHIAVAHKLAELIAPAITGDKVLKRTLMADADIAIADGGSADGMQGTPRRTHASRLVSARFRLGQGRYGLGGIIE